MLRQAAAALQAGDWKQAQQMVHRTLNEHPDAKIAHFLDAEIHRRMGNEVLAAAAMQSYKPENTQGLLSHVNNPDMAHYIPGYTAMSLAELGLADLAEQVLREGVKEKSRYTQKAVQEMIESYLAVSRLFYRRNQIDHMQEVLHTSMEIHVDKRACNILAIVAYQQGDINRALELWDQSLLLDAEQAEIHMHVGKVVLQELKDKDRALYHFKRVEQLDPALFAKLLK